MRSEPFSPRPTLKLSPFQRKKEGSVKLIHPRLSPLPRPAEATGVSSHTDPTRGKQA